MRGKERKQAVLFTATSAETLVARNLDPNHPLRKIKERTDAVLATLNADIDTLYSDRGRPSIPPEQVLRALLWQALFSVRSERQLEEVLTFDLRCRWFVGLGIDDTAWDHSTFSKLRQSLLLETLSEMFFARHLEFLRAEGLVSDEHLSVDGTLLAAWASQKSLIRKDDLDKNGRPPAVEGGRNAWVDFKGTKRSNATHVSATDPESRLASKGGTPKLAHELDVLADNRNNFVVGLTVTPPSGTSERASALTLVREQIANGHAPETVGADRAYSAGDGLVESLFAINVDPHFAVRDDHRKSLARLFHEQPGFKVSIRKRMRIEEIFAYLKGVCRLGQLKVRGAVRVLGVCLIGASAYNLTHECRLTRV